MGDWAAEEACDLYALCVDVYGQPIDGSAGRDAIATALRAAYDRGQAEEREECAALCDVRAEEMRPTVYKDEQTMWEAQNIAAEIRARGAR